MQCEDAYKVTHWILSRNTNVKELLFEDFRAWFIQSANLGGDDIRTIKFKATKSTSDEPHKFARLLLKCSRKSTHLSIPIQTFAPVSL